MNRTKKQRYAGLIALYVLLLITSSLIQQMKYDGLTAGILLLITVALLIILWKYLLRQHIISVSWTSLTYEPNPHKSERIFLFSIVTLVSPVLRFHELTSYDLIVSLIALLIAILGYQINERRLAAKEK